VTGDTNAVGLWRRSLHQDILWMRISRLAENEVTSPYKGSFPSWSWLSCPVGVSFDYWGNSLKHAEISDCITVQDFELSWAGEPYLSDIQSCNLTISGPARETYLEVALGGKLSNPPYFNIDGEVSDSSESAVPRPCSAQFDREEERSPDMFLCLLVRRRLNVSTGFRTETFLILERATTLPPHEKFRRIGLGMFRGYRDRFSSNTKKTVSLV
jgi:hypothetical protein